MQKVRGLKNLFIISLILMAVPCLSQNQGIETSSVITGDTSLVVPAVNRAELASDEGIKCTRNELLEKEFVTTGKSKYGEILRITFQDLERGGREIIFQKKLMENDEIKFYMPMDLIKEAKTAVLIVMKGEGMFFKKIDITD
jgi:hypothetical protein